jgi:2',3'-cyclic-nucleotide 2'-phosphodiesterase (5'-nucleotidase family)
MTNYAREDLINPDDSTMLTYTDLYRSFPFDNTIYIAEITGEEFMTILNRKPIPREIPMNEGNEDTKA